MEHKGSSDDKYQTNRVISSMLNRELKMINGPVNVVRLEGELNGINKVIYLFMDIHIDVENQTQCQNIFSQDVQKYFVESFLNVGQIPQMYDFFVEIYPSELQPKRPGSFPITEPKDRYIEEVVKVFQKIFNYDPRRNRVSVNEIFDHVRLHYLDIREYYKGSVLGLSADTVSIASRFMREDYISVGGLRRIVNNLVELQDYIRLIIDILANPVSRNYSDSTGPNQSVRPRIIDSVSNRKQDHEAMKYLANKIHYIYNHKNVRNEVNKLLDQNINNFRALVEEYGVMIDRFNEYIDTINRSRGRLTPTIHSSHLTGYGIDPYLERNMIADIINSTDRIHNEGFIEYFARFTDVYFLRRFLDKDYITNAVVYCGALHANSYIHFLVNNFDFKVTHASYSSTSNMKSLTKKIKDLELMETQELFLPPVLHQCSDLTIFPDNFS